MRLGQIKRGITVGKKIKLKLMALVTGMKTPDVLSTLTYRGKFFGAPWSRLTHEVLRGPSEWSVGERELFAAFVSRLNQCPF